MTLPLRCILVHGGHAGGKSTLVRWGRDRVGATTPGYAWHLEGSNNGQPTLSLMPVEQAITQGTFLWRDPAIHTLVVEGTRVYGPIFKIARNEYTIPRELWVLQLLQRPDVGRGHMRARCAVTGKAYNEYWDGDEADYQFAERHIAALRKILPSRPTGPAFWDPKFGEVLTLWVEPGHTNLGLARTWFANALRVPIVRTPVRLDEAPRPVRTPVHAA